MKMIADDSSINNASKFCSSRSMVKSLIAWAKSTEKTKTMRRSKSSAHSNAFNVWKMD